MREGFEPSIRVSVYTLSRRAPSATQTPHRVVTLLSSATGRYYRETTLDGQELFRKSLSADYAFGSLLIYCPFMARNSVTLQVPAVRQRACITTRALEFFILTVSRFGEIRGQSGVKSNLRITTLFFQLPVMGNGKICP